MPRSWFLPLKVIGDRACRRRGSLVLLYVFLLVAAGSFAPAGEIAPPGLPAPEIQVDPEEEWVIEKDARGNPGKDRTPPPPPAAPGLAGELAAEKLECRGETLSAENAYAGAMLEAAKAAAKSKEPEFLWARAEFNLEKARSLNFLTCRKDALEAAIREAQKLPVLEPIFASRLRWAEANFALQAGAAERARRLADQLGLIRDWMIIGPFNNKHGSFEYPAEDGLGREWPLALDKPRRGVKGLLSWRPVHTREPLGFVNLRAWLRPNEDCVAYAVCAVYVKRKTAAALRLGSDDMISAWGNGRRLYFLDGRRAAGFDQDAVAFTLKRGWNILLIQSGNAGEEWGFYARLTKLNGALLPGIRITADPGKISAAITALARQAKTGKTRGNPPTGKARPLLPPFQGALSVFAKKLESAPRDARTNYYLGWLLMARKGLPPTDRRDLKYLLHASKADLKNPVYYLAFADASIDRFPPGADRDENARRMALQYAMQLGDQEVEARTRLANYYLYSMRNPTRAEQLAADALKANPLALAAQLTRYDIYKLRGWSALATRLLDQLLLRYPDSREVLKRAGMDAFDREANAAAERYYQRLLELDHTSADAIRGVVEARRRLGRPPNFAALRKLLAVKPYDPFLRQRLVEAEVQARDYPAALAAIAEALAIAPDDAAMLEWKGRVLIHLGRREEALRIWDRVLALSPNLLSLKNQVEFLRNRKDNLCTPVPDLRELVLSYRDYPTRRGDSRLYLLRETADRINSDGTYSQATHYVVKILDQQASRELAVIKLTTGDEPETLQLITARVMRANGTIESAQHDDLPGLGWGKGGYQELNFAPLGVGDVIEVAYRRDQSRQDFLGDYFGEIFRFRYYYPVALAHYVLEIPLAREIHVRQSPEVPQPVITTYPERGVERREWEMRKLAGIELEPYMPPLSELSPVVQASSFKNWDDFARWYWQLVKEQYIADEDIRGKVKEITAGENSPEKKLDAIRRWVSENIQNVAWEFGIHGYKPYKTSTVFSRGFGDCKDKTALICVMARELGLEAYPALLRAFDETAGVVAGYSTGRGKEDLALPLLDHFNHSLSAVLVNGQFAWMDGTVIAGKGGIAGAVPALDAGAKAVVITPQGAHLEKLPSLQAEDNQWADTSELVLLASGEATLNQSVTLRGEVAVNLDSYISNRELFRLVLELLAKRRLGPLTVEKATLEQTAGEKVAETDITARMTLSRAARKEGETLRLRLPRAWLRGKAQASPLPERLSVYAAESVRAHDLLLPRPFLIKSETRVAPPSGWRFAWLPAAVEITRPFGSLRAEFELEGDILIVRRVLRLASTRIARRDYHAFRRFCFRADEIDDLEFVLEKIK